MPSLSPKSLFTAMFMSIVSIFSALEAIAVDDRTAHDFELPGIDGETLNLDAYRGNLVLLVNTASRCGFTSQYNGLQDLWERYRDKGLVVIGAPSNDFFQELKSADAVKQFCEVNFGIDFPMTGIVKVRGRRRIRCSPGRRSRAARPGGISTNTCSTPKAPWCAITPPRPARRGSPGISTLC